MPHPSGSRRLPRSPYAASVGRFVNDTAVEPLDDGRFGATIDPGWAVIDGAAPNGGYMLAVVARAMAAAGGMPDPLSVTGHFLAPCSPGPVEISCEVVRAGRRHATVSASLIQEGRVMTQALGVFGDLGAVRGPTVDRRHPSPIPPLADCAEPFTDRPDAPPIARRVELRAAPNVMGWATGAPTGEGMVGGWARWADGAPMDTFGLLVLADAFPPAVFNLDGLEVGWAPTVELTVQVRGRPGGAWQSSWFTTRSVTDGYLEEDGEVRDTDGRLLALSRQLALVPRPAGS